MTTFRYTVQLSDGIREVIIPALEVQSASGALSTARQIQSITAGGSGVGNFVLSGDVTFPEGSPAGPGIRFQPNDEFEVSNISDAGDLNIGTFKVLAATVTGVALGSPRQITTITTLEAIGSPPTLPYGQIRYATPGSPQLRTSLELSGKGSINYGEYLNANLLHLLENFGSTTPPNSPIEGQAWFNSSDQTLNIWRSVGSPQWMSLISQEDATEQFSVGAAGLDTHVQFNDGGVFGASDKFTFTKGTAELSLGGGSPILDATILTPTNTATNSSGVNLTITTGLGTGSGAFGASGQITIKPADNSTTTSTNAESVLIIGTSGIDTIGGNPGGGVTIKGGNSARDDGGNVIVAGGGSSTSALGVGHGGDVTIKGGVPNISVGRNGGSVIITAQDGANAGDAGSVTITSGSGSGLFVNSDAGDVNFIIGDGDGGTDGAITIKGATATFNPELQFYEQSTNGTLYVGLKSPANVTGVGSPLTSPIWTLPQDDPAVVSGQFLTTDANGIMSFAAGGGGGGLGNIVEDVTPQLGGNLDVNGFGITNDIIGSDINITTAAGSPAIASGDINITTGTSDTTSAGAINILGGDKTAGGAYDSGGDVSIKGGRDVSTGAWGGEITLYGGNGSNNSSGAVYIKAGRGLANTAGKDGAPLALYGAQGGTGGAAGGDIALYPGIGGDQNNQGGNLILSPWKQGSINITGRSFTHIPILRFFESSSNGLQSIGLRAPIAITPSFGSPLDGSIWTLPQDDPATASGQFLTTDASGVLSFATPAGGGSPLGLQNIVEDLTPQLGGNLDVNGKNITAAGNGGNVNVYAGTGVGTSGGQISLFAGSTDTSNGGYIGLYAGSTTAASAYGGGLHLLAGAGTGTGGYGGYINITGGTGSQTSGGFVLITGGTVNNAGTGYKAGTVTLIGGLSLGTGNHGGGVEILGHNGNGIDSNGGDVLIQSGRRGLPGSGNAGNITLSIGGHGVPTGVGAVIIAPGTSNTGVVELRFLETTANGTNYVGFKAPDSITGTVGSPLQGPTWVIPQDDPVTAAGKFLTTDASGVLSFATPAGGGGGSRIQDSDNDTFIETDLTGGGSPTINKIRFGVGTQQIEMSDYFGIMLIRGKESTTADNGGYVMISGGKAQATSTGNGGYLSLYGGDAQGVSGYGGTARLQSGFSANGYCGTAYLTARGSNPGSTGTGGSVYIVAGGSGIGNPGGDITLDAGPGDQTGTTGGDGGEIEINSGSAKGTGTASGNIRLIVGNQFGTDNASTAGYVSIKSGIVSGASTANGGDIKLEPGGGGGSGGLLGAVSLLPGGLAAAGETVELRFYENSRVDYIGLKAPATITATVGSPLKGPTWTLPQEDPAVVSGQFLTTDASGVLSFAAPAENGTSIDELTQAAGSPLTSVFNTTVDTTSKGGSPIVTAYVQVFVNGILQKEGAAFAFTVTGANQITFESDSIPVADADVTIYEL